MYLSACALALVYLLARLCTSGISVVAKIINERMTAQIEGDFVVFLIGLKVNA